MILLALNELNIDYIKKYNSKGKLPNFKKLFANGIHETISENKYELLEPWIQWTTVQTGLTYEEHKIFRLGDIVDRSDLIQIFEDLEQHGLSIGAISPFNASNRLKNPLFFIPDPWTQTSSSGGLMVNKFSGAISRIVNSNASGKLGFSDFIWLMMGFLKFVRLKRWGAIFKMTVKFRLPGIKAAILDIMLMEVFITLHKNTKPNYSHLFLNAGAHVQHHYLFNSEVYEGTIKNPEWYCPIGWDPLYIVLESYDRIIGDLLKIDEQILGVTGLHQIPHDDKTYYWRPFNHEKFLRLTGTKLEFRIIPRMSRDFLIELNSYDDAIQLEKLLNSYTYTGCQNQVFNVHNRGQSLFVEIIFDKEIDSNLTFNSMFGKPISELKNKLAFVAIKNGKHDGIGYVFSNKKIEMPIRFELKDIYPLIKEIALKKKCSNLNRTGIEKYESTRI